MKNNKLVWVGVLVLFVLEHWALMIFSAVQLYGHEPGEDSFKVVAFILLVAIFFASLLVYGLLYNALEAFGINYLYLNALALSRNLLPSGTYRVITPTHDAIVPSFRTKEGKVIQCLRLIKIKESISIGRHHEDLGVVKASYKDAWSQGMFFAIDHSFPSENMPEFVLALQSGHVLDLLSLQGETIVSKMKEVSRNDSAPKPLISRLKSRFMRS